MKDLRIGYVMCGYSDYDDEIWKVLRDRRPQQRFTEFDHLDLVDCFILAGADIKTTIDGDTEEIEIFINPNEKTAFVARLRRLIKEGKHRVREDDR